MMEITELVRALGEASAELDARAALLQQDSRFLWASAGVGIDEDADGPTVSAYVDAMTVDGLGFDWRVTVRPRDDGWELAGRLERSDAEGGFADPPFIEAAGTSSEALIRSIPGSVAQLCAEIDRAQAGSLSPDDG